ncbi:MAG: hypothetical protein ACI9ZH_001903 [Paracoccaceae bacterium]|jgi:hypothetical protein
MIYLAVIVIVAGWLAFRRARMQTRDTTMTALVAGMSRAEAQADYDECRARLSVRLAAADTAPAVAAQMGARMDDAGPDADTHALAERGAWMMDRIRGLEGRQTGPAPRLRAKLELMDAAARDAQGGGKRD